jgi:hypothetical protein
MDKPQIKQKECKRHGLTDFTLQKRGAYRCKKCIVEAVTNSRRSTKRKAVDYKGGKCELCGYSKCVSALEFHHRDPDKKDFGISTSGCTRSWEETKQELDKCVIVCANCHREIHDGMTTL